LIRNISFNNIFCVVHFFLRNEFFTNALNKTIIIQRKNTMLQTATETR